MICLDIIFLLNIFQISVVKENEERVAPLDLGKPQKKLSSFLVPPPPRALWPHFLGGFFSRASKKNIFLSGRATEKS